MRGIDRGVAPSKHDLLPLPIQERAQKDKLRTGNVRSSFAQVPTLAHPTSAMYFDLCVLFLGKVSEDSTHLKVSLPSPKTERQTFIHIQLRVVSHSSRTPNIGSCVK